MRNNDETSYTHVASCMFLITQTSMCMNGMFADLNEKCTRPKELRKGIIGRDHMLLQNSGARLGVEWSGNWQIAYQHESPNHSISVWNIVARRSSKIERVRGEGGSKCAKHGWFSRVQRNHIVQTISFVYVSIGTSIYKIFLVIFDFRLENYCLAYFPQNRIIILWIYIV